MTDEVRFDEIRVEMTPLFDIDPDDPDELAQAFDPSARFEAFAQALEAVFDRHGLEVVAGEGAEIRERGPKVKPDLAGQMAESQARFARLAKDLERLENRQAWQDRACLRMSGRVGAFLGSLVSGRLRRMRRIKTPVDLFDEAAPGAGVNISDATVVVSDHVSQGVAPVKLRITACFSSDTGVQAVVTRPGNADQTIIFNGGDTLGAGAAGEFGLRVKRGDTVNFQITVDGALRMFVVDLVEEGSDA